MKIEVALISVSDKTGLVELAGSLAGMGIKILSTGGSGKALKDAGIEYTPVSEHTGFPEILDGRVKTLHPRIHAGILARHGEQSHLDVLKEKDIPPIGLVVVNLYPFVQTIRKPGVTKAEAVEKIDIGGPTLIRAAAKNHQSVTVVVDPEDYGKIVEELESSGGSTSLETRSSLALKAFTHTASYDAAISGYLTSLDSEEKGLPETLELNMVQQASLRYGENPQQKAGLYRPRFSDPGGIVAAEQLHGKHLSFNNYLDLDASTKLIREFDETACAIIKHTNPCGSATGETVKEAYLKALSCDPVSAFGSIIAFNRPVSAEAAEELSKLFVEAVVAPGYEEGAVEILNRKKNIRIMKMDPQAKPSDITANLDIRTVSGGLLVQETDSWLFGDDQWKVATKREPTQAELKDLIFGWKVCKHVKSNAIVFAKNCTGIGIGAGQMSRVESVRLAGVKSLSSLEGAVMASDAFFPFRDGMDEAADLGIRAVIQPGGSVRDEEVIAAADERGLAMILTGMRHFRH